MKQSKLILLLLTTSLFMLSFCKKDHLVVDGKPCPGTPTVTDIDGNVYNTVTIGGQCWMKENLKTTRFRDGSALLHLPEFSDWYNTFSPAYVWYGNDISNKDKYGALYNNQNTCSELCPQGWRMPTSSDWGQLLNYVRSVGYNENVGNALKSCRQVNSPLAGECDTHEHPRWNQNDTHHGFDAFGFSALPGGFRSWYFDFGDPAGSNGAWWSTTCKPRLGTLVLYLDGNNKQGLDWQLGGPNGFSVRCIKD